MKSLNNVPAYRKFVRERDQALEVLLDNALTEVDNILKELFVRWIYSCLNTSVRSKVYQTNADDLMMIRGLQTQLEMSIPAAINRISEIIKRLRKNTYLLTVSSEAEAIGIALNKKTQYHPTMLKKMNVINRDLPTGDMGRKIQLMLLNVADKLKKQTLWLMMQKDINELEAIQSLIYKLPKSKATERKRALKRIQITEADSQSDYESDLSSGLITDEEWEDILDQYKSEISVDRSPETYFTIAKGSNEVKRYAWEMESEIVQDFVQQVRLGQIDAANENGITDFIWIAVVDDRTDECCLWRDGLTTKEIEQKLKTDHRGDECQTSVPPAHFNCATSGHNILTVNGNKKVEDIRPGDMVITAKGRSRKVLRTLQSQVKKTYLITLANGQELRVTEDHPFFDGHSWVPAKELTLNDKLIFFLQAHENDTLNKATEDILIHEIEQLSKGDRDV